jgi:RNA polymerase subunit RPABC4/transcription elongation factor Spt4
LYFDALQFFVGGVTTDDVWNRTTVSVRASLTNGGGLTEVNVPVTFMDEDATTIGYTEIQSITPMQTQVASINWIATCDSLVEVKTIYATVGRGLYEIVIDDNTISDDITVRDDRPDLRTTDNDLELDYSSTMDVPENTPFGVNVTIDNLGINTATNFSVDVYDAYFDPPIWLGNTTIESLIGGSNTTVGISCNGVSTLGAHDILVVVDPEITTDDLVPGWTVYLIGSVEEYNENNNDATITINVIQPDLTAIITLPAEGSDPFVIGEDTLLITGNVVRTDDHTQGIPNITLTIQILDSSQNVVDSGIVESVTAGAFTLTTIALPSVVDTYTIQITGTNVASTPRTFNVVSPPPVFPWWIILLIILIIIIIIVAVTLYLYFVGLGKTVQCGECSAFIPEGAKRCPKCGVEFEAEVAKCSVCNAWVPIDVKTCPECGTEFTVGIEELEDYETKMKRQYDQVVSKFRGEAKKDLGETFTETEFQAWWATQATFITFDQWLKEEEEMKRMGSKPCPACGMENSVTAKICHKCGSLMEEEKPKPKAKPPAEKPKEPAPVEEAATTVAPAAAAAAPPTAAPAAAPPEKKKCPSCGMEVAVTERTCPICNYDFEGKPEEKPPAKPPATPPPAEPEKAEPAPVKRVVRKPVKRVVRRPADKE